MWQVNFEHCEVVVRGHLTFELNLVKIAFELVQHLKNIAFVDHHVRCVPFLHGHIVTTLKLSFLPSLFEHHTQLAASAELTFC